MSETTETAQLVGRRGQLRLYSPSDRHRPNECEVEVVVRRVRHHFGRVDLLVEPVAGSGEVWVSVERVTFDDG